MRFVLHVNMDSDNFREDTGPEVARSLRLVAEQIEHWTLDVGDLRLVRDSTGHVVGEWEVEGPTCPLCDAPLPYKGALCPNARLSAHS